MGHTYAEMDPTGAEKARLYRERIQKIREDIKDINLGEFTVKEFIILMSIMGYKPKIFIDNIPNSDLIILEAKILNRSSQ